MTDITSTSSRLKWDAATAAEGNESIQETSFHINPNPAEDHATIQFNLPQSSHVCIKVYDVSGKGVGVVFDAERQQGQNSLQLNTNHFPKGVYFVRMISDFGIQNQKLIVQ